MARGVRLSSRDVSLIGIRTERRGRLSGCDSVAFQEQVPRGDFAWRCTRLCIAGAVVPFPYPAGPSEAAVSLGRLQRNRGGTLATERPEKAATPGWGPQDGV